MKAITCRPREGARRGLCLACLRAPANCYCRDLERFDPSIRFVILIHGREAQKHVATGRISHLCLEGSRLVQGFDYSADERVNELLADPRRHCAVLFPGEGSTNLSALPEAERRVLVPAGKELTLFVIDGTWSTARKTMARSANLAALPRYSFQPPAPSRIRLRLQPGPHCITTLEAIHQAIELLGPGQGFDTANRRHDALLRALDAMVNRQVELARHRFRPDSSRLRNLPR